MLGLFFAESVQAESAKYHPTSSRQRFLPHSTNAFLVDDGVVFRAGTNLSDTLHQVSSATYFDFKGTPSVSSPVFSTAFLIITGVLLFLVSNSRIQSKYPSWIKKLLPRQNNPLAHLQTPPVVHIPFEIQSSPQAPEAYVKALEDNGSDVVIIPRHGRMEYVVDYRHVNDVLTDSTRFSFEHAVLGMLHMDFMQWFNGGSFVQDLEKLVSNGVVPRLRPIVELLASVFTNEAHGMFERIKSSKDEKLVISDTYHWVHRSIAEAMVILIFGERYNSPEMTQDFMKIAVAISELAGIFENTKGWKRFPGLWSLKTTLWAIFGTIVPTYFFKILPQLWRNRQFHLERGMDVENNEYAPFFDLSAARRRNVQTGKLGLVGFAWSATVCLGIIFASIHQTAVVAAFCVLILAQKQDEYLPALQQEWAEAVAVDAEGNHHLTVDSLRDLSLLDSFIREVMRTKGDTFAPVRWATKDTQVGPYLIPKNSLCAPYVKRAHEHPDNYGEDGKRFDGFQWHRKNKPAAQGSHDFISFGLGRFACPGRHLAICEIKMVLVTLFDNFDVQVRPNTYKITDHLNTTAVPPEGILEISRKS